MQPYKWMCITYMTNRYTSLKVTSPTKLMAKFDLNFRIRNFKLKYNVTKASVKLIPNSYSIF